MSNSHTLPTSPSENIRVRGGAGSVRARACTRAYAHTAGRQGRSRVDGFPPPPPQEEHPQRRRPPPTEAVLPLVLAAQLEVAIAGDDPSTLIATTGRIYGDT